MSQFRLPAVPILDTQTLADREVRPTTPANYSPQKGLIRADERRNGSRFGPDNLREFGFL